VTAVDDISRRLIALALTEDLAGGDATAAATIPADSRARAHFVARSEGVVAGLDAVSYVVASVDETVTFAALTSDGDTVTPGRAVAEVAGPARSILAAERTALNLLTHLSGVATATAAYVAAVAGTGCRVRDTRKTLPGMRALQKAAVAAGGGTNHRFSLGDGLLVKDNHVAAAGGVGAATTAALAAAGDLPVQIEVDTLAQLHEALDAGARSVLLDNFALAEMADAVGLCRAVGEPVFVEASGNITLDTVRDIAATGVDAVAVGALTHSVRTLDIGLDWEAA
jgi:nicotinate-nucleotide pyrophosphorylase (carboxylating)